MESRSCSLEAAKQLEDKFLASAKRSSSKFVDTQFPATANSMGSRALAQGVEWARLSDVLAKPALFVDGVGAGDVIQGEIGDCWFLGAMSVVATRNDLMYPLFIAAHPELGFYQIKFFLDGMWRVVTIDDYIPFKCNVRMRLFKAAHCKDENEMWVPLMEKAAAKLVGSYENLQSGNFSEGLSNLTGEGCEHMVLTQQMVRDGTMWDKMRYFDAEAFLMGCSIKGAGETDNGRGLLVGHAYAILRTSNAQGKRLIQLRNPWGMKEWTGAYSDGSREWNDTLKRELNHVFADDGTFWMTYDDWIKNFNDFAVCRLLTDEIGKVWEKRMFHETFRGGCCNHSTWVKNPQFWLQVPSQRPVQVFVHLAQEDTRSRGVPMCKVSIGCYLFRADNISQQKTSRTADDASHTPTFMNSREYSISMTLAPGNYILMPCTFDSHDSPRYFLTVYSEDPILTGHVGKGAVPKMAPAKTEFKSLAWLSRPGAPAPPVPRRPHAPHIVSAAPPPPIPKRDARNAPPSPRASPAASSSSYHRTEPPASPSYRQPEPQRSYSSSSSSSTTPAAAAPRTIVTTTTTTTTSRDGVKTTRTTKTVTEGAPPHHSPPPPQPSYSSHSSSSGGGGHVVQKSVFCKRCLRSIKPGETFISRNGKSYCPKHAYEKCKGCKKDLTGGTVLKVGGKQFHPACFKCSQCRAGLGTSFYKKNGKICCQRCASK